MLADERTRATAPLRVVAADAIQRDPRRLDGVDLVVAPGELAVAENGAVWVDGRRLSAPAALFLAERLIVTVPGDALVETLHDAYARVDPGAAPYGVFIAGPSKTADIEQALVIGAHGPRSMLVVIDEASVTP